MSLSTRWSHFRTSFQFRLFCIFSLLTFLSACLLSTFYVINQDHKAREHATEKLVLQARYLADSIRLPLYAENSEILHQLADETARTPEIRAVTISTAAGRVLVDIRPKTPSDSTKTISQTVEVYSSQLIDSPDSALSGVNDASVVRLGSVRLERGTDDLSRALHRMILLATAIALAFWLAVSLVCRLILQRVTHSFNTLMQGITRMQDGDFTSHIDISSDDEPGRAAHAINNLAHTLQVRTGENERLQEERLEFERQMLQAQKLESMGVMAGGIAHDFNNLLQVILGNLELAKRISTVNPEALNKHIDHAVSSARRAALLTGLMLTYVGKGLIFRKSLNLNELIRDNAELLKTAASSTVSTELHLSDELPVILADEGHVQQVVMNLITNAAESIVNQPGSIRITTGTQECDRTFLAASLLEEKPEPGNYVFLEVSDNGCGMNGETLKRLFDPFFTTKFTGRGLGMSAVLGIMRTHNGALFVETNPGKGTTFRALFPIQSVSMPMDQTRMPHPLSPERTESDGAIETDRAPGERFSGVALVVDDEKSVLRICTKMVQLCGLTSITACDGQDAVDKFREHADEIVVVIMDLTMPKMDGIAAMCEIYRISPDARVILSSGFNEDELSERITCQPPAGFIRKPYSMNALEAEIKRVMRGDSKQ